MSEKKPINEKICDLMAQIMALQSSADEIRAQIADRKKEIRQQIKDLGFDVKAFNKVLEAFIIMRDPNKKAQWLELQQEVAKIQVALHQPTLFEYARQSGIESFQ